MYENKVKSFETHLCKSLDRKYLVVHVVCLLCTLYVLKCDIPGVLRGVAEGPLSHSCLTDSLLPSFEPI